MRPLLYTNRPLMQCRHFLCVADIIYIPHSGSIFRYHINRTDAIFTTGNMKSNSTIGLLQASSYTEIPLPIKRYAGKARINQPNTLRHNTKQCTYTTYAHTL